jgi:hypothetical protein
MAFLGQLYGGEHFPMGGHLALQIYVHDDCMDVGSQLVHLELLPMSSPENLSRVGIKHQSQNLEYIHFTPIEDSIDQWAFHRKKLS